MSTITAAGDVKLKAAAQPQVVPRRSLLDIAVVAAACLVFLGLTLYQLDLPGLYPDEAFDVIPSMQLLLGHKVDLLDNAGLHIFGLELPLMSSSAYQGVTSTYLALPFFAVGGINIFALRFMTVSLGVVALLLTYLLASQWFGRAEARLAVLMMAVAPAWVFWSRLGVYVVSEVVPIAAGALLAFTIWTRRRPLGARNGALYTGTLLLGLGLTTKLLFLWFITALAFCAFVFYGRLVWQQRALLLSEKRKWLRIPLLAFATFCLGASPFILYNLKTRGTFYLIRGSASLGPTAHGVDNRAFLRNLWTETDAFKVLLDGGYFWFQGVLSRTFSNPFTPAVFAVSSMGLIVLILLAKKADTHKLTMTLSAGTSTLAVSLIWCGLLAFSLLPTANAAGTLMMLFALGTALSAVGLLVWDSLRDSRRTSTVCGVLLAAIALSGSLWWFRGSGRPEGRAVDGFLGLWPVDAAGVLFWLAAIGLVILLGADPRPAPLQRPAAFVLGIVSLILVQSVITVSGLWSTHILILLPLPQVLIAAFAVAAGKRLATHWRVTNSMRARMLRVLPAVIIVGSVLVCDVGVDYLYHKDLRTGGGSSTFSDTIYELSHYLEASGKKVVAMDWGFRRPVQFLTLERIDPIEAYGLEPTPSPQFFRSLQQLLTDPDTLYLFHTLQNTAYPRLDAFTAQAQQLGKSVKLERTFFQREGSPVYEVYSAR